MHPADKYEAFAKLHSEEGMSAEDIAARFGVTAAVVRQRLKLGAVSPKLWALYRKGDMNLDQLSAFAITEITSGRSACGRSYRHSIAAVGQSFTP
jgi:ParB family chromosome partitioning protein